MKVFIIADTHNQNFWVAPLKIGSKIIFTIVLVQIDFCALFLKYSLLPLESSVNGFKMLR